ncbi:MAG TPA: DNA-directed RNA polymerase subunit beta', partial [Anaerolineae bacterium]|nr:DNA-directed RNA polymerase subunit beta' [Anaerolineae bacterium]
TLRTFHTGGVAAGGDITHGLPRVEELFEARKKPRGEAIMSDIDGVVEIVRNEGGMRLVKVKSTQMLKDDYEIPGNWALKVESGQEVIEGDVLATRGDQAMVAKHAGKVSIRKNKPLAVLYEMVDEREYEVAATARMLVDNGQEVAAGMQLSEGALNPHRILRILGRDATQLYLLQEVQKVYRSQGVNINDKHYEVIVRKMMNRVQIVSSGDGDRLPGELVDRLVLQDMNEQLIAEGKRGATAVPVLLGVTKAALSTESFLSASSFQHTIKVLAGAAIEGKTDFLLGLKETVIIGKLIPAGTGYKHSVINEIPEVVEEMTDTLLPPA